MRQTAPRGGQADIDRFLRAVIAGDHDAVRTMLAADQALAHVRDDSGRSAFALALLERHAEIAASIRTAGYEPDLHESALALDWARFDELAVPDPLAVNNDHPLGGTAMVAAALGGAGSDMWRVYRYHGDPNGRPRGAATMSAVRAAIEFPDLPTAEVTAATLLGNGADPNLPEPKGRTALHAAAERGSTVLIEMLLRKDARADARDNDGRLPLDLAESARHDAAARMLRRHRDVPRDHSTSRRAYDVHGRPYRPPTIGDIPALERERIVGASHGAIDVVTEALQRDVRFAHVVATTTEATVEAGAHMGRTDMVDLLLEHGAPYALPTAVMRGDTPRVRELLVEDPQRIHERGAHDFALLWYPVIGGGRIDLAELLINAGAEVEQQHFLGTTALHLAAARGQLDMVAFLIEHGADVNRTGRKFGGESHTPLQLAEESRSKPVAQLLRDHGARR